MRRSWCFETNAPYGELIANQSAAGYDERYKFTGKERDKETGYDFFGARYYSSVLTHWLSVDPLADKYPWISPYAYCGWNPIKNIDKDGRFPDAIWDALWIAYDIASVAYDHYTGDNRGRIEQKVWPNAPTGEIPAN